MTSLSTPSQMRRRLGSRIALSTAASVLAIATPAIAQNTAPADDEAIIVTGIRGSLQRNLDIKRAAPGVVEAISAEDIGKFPDTNVASALQRLPGVAISRDGRRGEANGIIVRGFGGDFNETLVDGRHLSTATGGRSIDFTTVGTDFVGGMRVYKTPDVSLGASAIGATLNILMPKPLDKPGFHSAIIASGQMQSRREKISPTVGALVSNTFADDTIGVLAYAAYRRNDTSTNRVFIPSWVGGYSYQCQLTAQCRPDNKDGVNAANEMTAANQTILRWFPQQNGAEQVIVRDERFDARVAVQWQPTENLLLTLDDNFSRQTVHQNSYGYAAWFNGDDLRNIKLDSNGTITDFTQFGTPMDYNSGVSHNVRMTNQIGANLKWDASENLRFELDATTSRSWLNPNGGLSSQNSDIGFGGINVGSVGGAPATFYTNNANCVGPDPAAPIGCSTILGANTGVRILGNSSSYVPEIYNVGPAGNTSQFLNTALMGTHVLTSDRNKNDDRIREFRGSVEWHKDTFSVMLGGQYREDKFNIRSGSLFYNNLWQSFAGYGLPSGRDPGVINLPASLFTGTLKTDGFIPGYDGNLAPGILKYNSEALYSYLESLGNPQTKNIPGFNYGDAQARANYTGSLFPVIDPGSFRQVQEKTWSVFMKTNFETEIANMPFRFNAGIRAETTHLRTDAVGRQPTALLTSASDPTLLSVTLSPPVNVSRSSSYTFLLPSVDAKLEITPELNLRLDASRTLTRPGLGSINPVVNVSTLQRIGSLTGSGGNPDLLPYLSDNFDAALEWYYQQNSYIAVDFFLKHVTNFVVNGVTRTGLNGIVDPTTRQPAIFAVSASVNGPEATIRGVEIALQHVFGDSGFGLQANGTFVGTNKPYDRGNLTTSGFAVTGLANSANFVGFYDKNGFQARVSANWRDEYISGFGGSGAFGAEPIYVDKQVQVDLSTSYDITEQLTIFAEALNVNNSTYSTHGRFSNQPLDIFSYGRRFTAGARFRF
jgi:TonB-dependent receptor